MCAYVCACMCSKNRVERSVSVQRRVTGGLVRQESCRTQHICSEEEEGNRRACEATGGVVCVERSGLHEKRRAPEAVVCVAKIM